MAHVLAVLDDPGPGHTGPRVPGAPAPGAESASAQAARAQALDLVAAALGDALGARVERMWVDGTGRTHVAAAPGPPGAPGAPGTAATSEDVDRVAAAVDDPDCLALVVGDGQSVSGLDWDLVRVSDKPVVLVPERVRPPMHPVGRVLLPLDGSPEAAAAVSGAARLFAGAGVDLVALHVFGEAGVPRFWDQAAHAGPAWSEEFLSRNLPVGAPRLELRCGPPGEHVIDVAEGEDIDLIGLGWSRDLTAGRARTVRETVARSGVPVLLCPVLGHHRPAGPAPPAPGDLGH